MHYFAFAIADGMFPAFCTVRRRPLSPEQVKELLALRPGMVWALNPSHKPTIDAARARFGLEIQVPEKAPQISLGLRDTVIVMSVRGLPRMEGRHEYTVEEIAGATFAFAEWRVTGVEE